MKLYGVVPYVIGLLQWEGRVSYRALQVEFALAAETLEALKIELIQVKRLAVDQDGEMLIWVGSEAQFGQPPAAPRSRHAIEVPAVAAFPAASSLAPASALPEAPHAAPDALLSRPATSRRQNGGN